MKPLLNQLPADPSFFLKSFIFGDMILPDLFVAPSPERDRGVFTAVDLPADTIIEIAPVIVMSATDRQRLDQTLLHDYIFEWLVEKEGEACCMALGYVPLYNHKSPANCDYEMDFISRLIRIRTVRPVSAGEELFINYNGEWDNVAPVWFDTK